LNSGHRPLTRRYTDRAADVKKKKNRLQQEIELSTGNVADENILIRDLLRARKKKIHLILFSG
jgi:hypothetical protein